MYKILIIDDDSAFLERFYRLVDWDKYDFEVVARLYDGEDAVEYISQNSVDAVITDIRMPELSGIDLAQIISESYPDIKVVFFSAFRDFKYATQAIKYDVVGYINKPIYIDQLEEAFTKLKAKLDEKNDGNKGELVDTKVIAEREEIFCRLLDTKQTHSDFLKDELGRVNILYQSLYQQCALAIFEIEGIEKHISSKWKRDIKNFYEAITKVVCVDTHSFYTVQLNFTDNKLVALYISKRGNTLSKSCISAAAEDLREIFSLEVTKTEFLTFESISDFKSAVAKADKPALKYVKKAIEQRKDREILREVERYVAEHYEEDIDLDSIANQFHFNYQYFSKLFKNVMGEKFIDYLNRIRIEKAKELLIAGENIEELYSKIGYNSKQHFYRVFSSYTGSTPAQYRKKMSEVKK